MVAKVAGGIIGLGLIGTGSVAMAKPEWFGINKGAPEWHSIAKDDSSKGASYTGKWGEKWKNYLVGVTNKKEGNKSNSKDWWEWSFERLKKDEPKSTKFKYAAQGGANNAVKSAYADDNNNDNAKALNQICKAAYQADKTKVTDTGGQANEYKEEDVWKYCSGLAEKPKTIADNKETEKYTTDNAIGKDETNSKKLVSTTGNNLFWEIRDKEFKKAEGYGKIEETEDAFFKNEDNSTTTIRELCEKAYKVVADSGSTGDATKPTSDKALKYCSLKQD